MCCCSCILKIQTSCCSHGYCRSSPDDAHHVLTVISLPGYPAESMGDRLKKQAILDEKIKKFLAVRLITCFHSGSLLFIIITINIMCNIECWNFYVCIVLFLLLLLLRILACWSLHWGKMLKSKEGTRRQCWFSTSGLKHILL